MSTVRMKKGDKYADIFDSEETIKQAQLDGYSIVEDKKSVVKENLTTEKKETTEGKITVEKKKNANVKTK